MRLILLNGPPSSGKDTAALQLRNHYNNVLLERFSMPLKASFAAVSGSKIDDLGNVEPYESHKEDIIPWLGVSYRQWQIDMSEKFMKVQYGQTIFGHLLAERLSKSKADLVVVPDSGFADEIRPIIARFGADNVTLVRVHRQGFTFAGDSRSYISNLVPHEVDLYNNTDLRAYTKQVLDLEV